MIMHRQAEPSIRDQFTEDPSDNMPRRASAQGDPRPVYAKDLKIKQVHCTVLLERHFALVYPRCSFSAR